MTLGQALLSFALVVGLLTIIPGLDTALVIRGTVTRGRPYGFAALLGIQVGTLIWGAAAATGAAALLAASEVAYRVLSYAGAAYLVYLGATMIATTFRRGADPSAEAAAPSRGGARSGFLLGLVTNITNPKVGVFYMATIPQFVPAGQSPLLVGLLLALVHCTLGTVWLGAIILGTNRLAPRLRSTRVIRWMDRITGGVLMLFGARLALDVR
ncbi:Threonine/homoserine/homoserine lactone efflux protein [Microbacterium azadirachtae]|uniref:Threonine/homoserine/homoserine lactone efflux protein n=1 Tax=Microbacterium azadirachtae TaxID=582680 RepID=A0A1I6IA01_9MICO|nr:LysE family translocator [Microbacterium azadirachtae]SFR63210.1 Threonine/homoserine/homoserine lactone efflux protein [Microbacterium azadirachtae]